MNSMDRQLRGLRIQGYVLVCALVVQYALGMYVNLYVSFPDGLAGGQLWEYAWSQTPLGAHIVLAILILLGAIVCLVRALIFKNRTWTIASVVGLLAIIAAGGSGAIFIPLQADLYSYAMSLAFLVAILSYAWALFSRTEKRIA